MFSSGEIAHLSTRGTLAADKASYAAPADRHRVPPGLSGDDKPFIPRRVGGFFLSRSASLARLPADRRVLGAPGGFAAAESLAVVGL